MPEFEEMVEQNQNGPALLKPEDLVNGLESIEKADGTKLDVKITKDEEDADEQESHEDTEEEEVEEELEQDESEDEEESEEDEEVLEDEESDEEDTDEEDDDEESSEDEEDEEEIEEESEDSEDTEEDEDLMSDSEETSEKEEFDVYDFTDGVFESKEDLKKTSDLMKENPQLKQMLEFYQENGTLLPWLEATQIDVDAFSDIDILKESFRSENAELGIPQSELDVLFEDEVLSRYNLDSEDEQKKRIGGYKMKKDAAKVRKELKEQQQEFLLPEERDVNEQAKKIQEEDAKQLTSAKNKLGFQIRKQIKDGKIKIETSKNSFVEMKVSPKRLNEMIKTLQDVEIFKGSDGSFDLRKMAIITNTDGFLSSVISDAKASGQEKFVKDKLKNRKLKGKSKQKTKKEVLGQKPPTSLADLRGAKIEIVQRN